MEYIFVKPAEGRAVRLDNGMLLPTEGLEVIRTSYIDRRILAGDVITENKAVENKNSKSKNEDRR